MHYLHGNIGSSRRLLAIINGKSLLVEAYSPKANSLGDAQMAMIHEFREMGYTMLNWSPHPNG